MASNMDGAGTFEMHKVLQKQRMLTIMRKHYTLEDWDNAVGDGLRLKYVRTGTGRTGEDAQDYTRNETGVRKYVRYSYYN